jgi:serine/threonine protein kinase
MSMTLARIGRFQVERALGNGTFASVWLARDDDLDALVAIKLLGDAWSRNEDARRRFIDEARALRRLDDDRIVRVYEVGRLADDRPYLVMEYADRGTLSDRMQLRAQLGQRFSVAEAVDLAIAMAGCLVAVHDHRIVHRDVKPSNVLFRSLTTERREALRREGRPPATERVLLGDFGIARRIEAPGTATVVVGSPRYMAPEQADPDRAGAADERSDVYSAAVVLFELLMGRVPFRFDSIGDLQRFEADPPEPVLRRARPDVPPGLARAVHRGMERDPSRRFSSAEAWMEALASARAEAAAPSVELERVLDLRSGTPSGPRAGAPAGTATAVRSIPVAASTVQLDPSTGTAVLVVPDGSPVPLPPRRVAAVVTATAGVALLVCPALPWVSGPDRLGLHREVMGTAMDAGAAAAAIGAALLVCAWRLWRTGRRWIARTWAVLAFLLGTAGLVLAGYVGGGLIGSAGATPRSGLLVVAAGGTLGVLAGWAELRRLRRIHPPGPGVRSAPVG